MEIDIRTLLKTVLSYKASDLHIVVGSEPQVRIDGRLVPLDLPPFTRKEAENICYSLINEHQKASFEETKELDFAITLPEFGRFRCNYYVSLGNIAAAFRVIPSKVPSLEDLGAPPVYKEILHREKGLILVTGPTGSGKTTTLNAMLNEVNQTERKHILTIEDPVEFLHEKRKALFSHRTVGEDTSSFARAIKAALREDPDIILVGEMRDKETIAAALTAAETGHLVLGTLHTNSAPSTINRIVDVFEGNVQPQIRAQLSSTLIASISQVLVPKIGGGRACVPEIMINTPAIGNLIRENKVHQIPSQMMIGQSGSGMITQNQELLRLVNEKVISKENALQYSNRQDEIKGKLV